MKPGIRQTMLQQRAALSPEQRKQEAQWLASRLLIWLDELALPPNQTIIAGYAAYRDELDLSPAFHLLATRGYTLALPCVEDGKKQLIFRRYNLSDSLITGAYGILQPDHNAPKVMPTAILCPLLAADKSLNRLGYGGGYYDRTIGDLRQQNPDLVVAGIGFDCQLLDSLPFEAHDATLDYMLTPSRCLKK